MELTCFFDFLCPWAYQASLWLRHVRTSLGSPCRIHWRFFSLEEHNHFYGDDWHIWHDSFSSPRSKGLLPFLVGAAVEAQEPEALDRFYLHIGKLWHEEKAPPWHLSTLLKAVHMADIDTHSIEAQLADTQQREVLLTRLRCDHEDARNRYNVSGTPSLILPGGRAVYLGMMPSPPQDQALMLFEAIRTLTEQNDCIFEVKRLRTPEEEQAITERIAHVRQAMFS